MITTHARRSSNRRLILTTVAMLGLMVAGVSLATRPDLAAPDAFAGWLIVTLSAVTAIAALVILSRRRR